MSIVAMNWAWQLRLKPTIKFVLMALADASDDDGYCWPSVPTIAYKTCLDDRSVQRILKKLKSDGLVLVEQRFRKDGSRTSNGYRLSLAAPGGKLPPPVPEPCRDVVTPATPPGGSSVTETTKEHLNEAKLQQPGAESAQESGGVSLKNLPFEHHASFLKFAGHLRTDQQQDVADEFAGQLRSGKVRKPEALLRTLAAAVRNGTLTLDAARAERQRREAETRVNADLEAARNIVIEDDAIRKGLSDFTSSDESVLARKTAEALRRKDACPFHK